MVTSEEPPHFTHQSPAPDTLRIFCGGWSGLKAGNISAVILSVCCTKKTFKCKKYKYTQTCSKKSPLGQRKSGLLRQVTS